MRILLIDDDEDIFALVRVAFRSEPIELVWAATALEGLRLFDQTPPNLVLCDIGLPDVDGVHLAHALHDRQPQIPLIFLTGHTTEMDREDAKATGARDYIAKPFKIKELVSRVKAVLE
jgi:DNA-binding response OmpR family regulator